MKALLLGVLLLAGCSMEDLRYANGHHLLTGRPKTLQGLEDDIDAKLDEISLQREDY